MKNTTYQEYLRNNVSLKDVKRLYFKMCDRCRYVHDDYKTYNGIEIKWENVDDFVKWFYNVQTSYRCLKIDNKAHEYQMDKDLKGLGYYGPQSVVFIPKYLNAMLETRAGSRGDLPLGVSHGRNGSYSVYISVLGKSSHVCISRTVKDVKKAFYIYKIIKEYYIKSISKEYFNAGLIEEDTMKLFHNYKIIDDTKTVEYDVNDEAKVYFELEMDDKFSIINRLIKEYSIPKINEMKDNVLEF